MQRHMAHRQHGQRWKGGDQLIRPLFKAARAAAFLLSLTATPAHAQKTATAVEMAKVHYQAGSSFYEKGMFAAALKQFQSAYDAAPTPALLYNMAMCQEKLGELSQALELLRKFEIALPFNKQREKVAAKIKELESKLEARPAPVPKPKPEPKPEPEPAKVEKVPATKDLPAEDPAPPPDDAPEKKGRLWTWVAAGVAGAMGVTALGLGISTNLDHAELKESCGQTQEGCAEEDIDRVGLRSNVTDVFIGLTAGAAVAAVVLFFMEGSGGDEPPASAWISPRSGGATVGVGTSF